uniref:receptor protein-tyrosine kinase n=3 Tax=Lygus hesperus TaxID=30085 RepID=A0A146M4S1_LYGHE
MRTNWLTVLVLLILTVLCCMGSAEFQNVKFVVSEKRQEATINIGQTVNLTCSLEKESATKITWMKNGSKIVANQPRIKLLKEMLSIRNVKTKDEGEYSCHPEDQGTHKTSEQKGLRVIVLKVRNERGKPIDNVKDSGADEEHDDDEHETSLTEDESAVPFFTDFSTMHDSIAKTVGDNCTLFCSAYGIPLPSVKWLKDGAEMASTPQNSQLDLISITKNDSGNYTCEISNANGTIRHTTQLSVFDSKDEMPIIIETPTNMNVSKGQDAIFDCKVAPDPPSSIKWVKHTNPLFVPDNAHDFSFLDKNMIIYNDHKHQVLPDGKLIIKSTQLEDAASYTCLVQSTRGLAYSTVTLEVSRAMAPEFTKPEKMKKPCAKPAGSTLRLTCHARGVPTPKLKWFKNGQPPKRSLGTVKYGLWSLVLEDVVVTDSGNYTCEVCNHECINFTYKVLVQERIRHRPILTLAPQNQTAVIESTVVMKCIFLSDLHPHLVWSKGKVSVPNSSDTSFLDSLVKAGDSNNTDPEKLILHNVTHNDEGWYTCIAGNTLGFSHSSAYLRVVDELELEKEPFPFNVVAAIVISLVFLILTLIVLNSFRTLKREKIKKLHALEAERAAAITQWIKKVIVEKQCHEQDTLLPIVKIEKQKSRLGNAETLVSEYELPLDSDWEFPRTDLELSEVLGEGAFGKVVKAEARSIAQPDVTSVVAVKMLKEGHTDAELMVLVSEMEMMKMIGRHRNIINLLGCCTQGGPLFVIVEYAPHGNLRDFLRQHRPPSGYEPAIGEDLKDRNTLTQKDLVSFAYQVARGMDYLASMRCIHRDLAARNVLVSDNYILKIADFGLARDIQSNDYYRKTTDGRLPVKWMAPEALFHRVYTSQSDVWSYGVLLYEIMTLGGTPYPSVPSMEKLFQLLRSGHRMEKPSCCSLEMYLLMRDCWSYQPSERPTFSSLVKGLDEILTATANEDYLDLGLPQLDTPPSSQESSINEQFPYLL